MGLTLVRTGECRRNNSSVLEYEVKRNFGGLEVSWANIGVYSVQGSEIVVGTLRCRDRFDFRFLE